MVIALIDLTERGDDQTDGLFDSGTFCALIGFEDVLAFERKWSGVA